MGNGSWEYQKVRVVLFTESLRPAWATRAEGEEEKANRHPSGYGPSFLTDSSL